MKFVRGLPKSVIFLITVMILVRPMEDDREFDVADADGVLRKRWKLAPYNKNKQRKNNKISIYDVDDTEDDDIDLFDEDDE